MTVPSAPEPNIAELEQAATEDVTSDLRVALQETYTQLWATWPGDDAELAERLVALRSLPLHRLNALAEDLPALLLRWVGRAYRLGLVNAQSQASIWGINLPPTPIDISETVLNAVNNSPALVAEQVKRTRVLIHQADTLEKAMTALAVAHASVPRVERATTWVTNRANNDAISDAVAGSDEVVAVWRAERDACVHCLAYQGEIDTGSGYPGGLTFGKKALHDASVERPPLHPNCRCDQITLAKHAVKAIQKALKREAKRSILRGWSLESESEATRLAAAEKLLARGTRLPKSVDAYARRALKKGHFPNGARFPE